MNSFMSTLVHLISHTDFNRSHLALKDTFEKQDKL